jgi:hypothetical protein
MRPFAEGLHKNQRPLPGEGATVFVLADADKAPNSLAQVTAIRLGRFALLPGSSIDARVEAAWICETLERNGLSLAEMDAVLCGANGWKPLDQMYLDVTNCLASLAGRMIPCGAYKHGCGEYYGASAFGLLTAVGLVRGEIPFAHCHPTVPVPRPPRHVLLYTLSPGGCRAMCCVCA